MKLIRVHSDAPDVLVSDRQMFESSDSSFLETFHMVVECLDHSSGSQLFEAPQRPRRSLRLALDQQPQSTSSEIQVQCVCVSLW